MMKTARLAPRIEHAGVDAWTVRLFDDIAEENMPWILSLVKGCEALFSEALIDIVPSYTTVWIQYNLTKLSSQVSRQMLVSLLQELRPLDISHAGSIKEIPVWYHSSVGPELERLQDEKGLSLGEVIAFHTENPFRVFALGFAPGFAFMGSLPDALVLPRLSTPRQQVAVGSVAIAERQTAAYPQATPGGWNVIGRTPLRLFDPQREAMSYLQVGDRVQFVSITQQEFKRLGGDDR
ncbi:5-oxoprolinase subunit B family protein [Nitrincola nitratireducens]|uniref:Sporulation inhibitor kipI n=1 Tax=Nitrincola nitratireducens TaxID=1229521 RepID=W9VPG3_9GAMM|nr:allophanate hydrolase subunit 1 [Nitrincola nitratireducens]EXJ12325.1 Sporulation inhibitor kipI [Nitrincola nitratireducens]